MTLQLAKSPSVGEQARPDLRVVRATSPRPTAAQPTTSVRTAGRRQPLRPAARPAARRRLEFERSPKR